MVLVRLKVVGQVSLDLVQVPFQNPSLDATGISMEGPPKFPSLIIMTPVNCRCIAYAERRYRGLHAQKMEGSLPFSQRQRQDLLIFGDDNSLMSRQD